MDITERLRTYADANPASSEVVEEAVQEILQLRKERDELEEILIILSRTELPWDENGNPTEGLPHFKERYVQAMHDASELLGLNLRSTITRTEPKTM